MADTKKPNILVIWGDDIGISNLSCYSHGLMGYQTPNIDRLAKEGMMFTDSYGERSPISGPRPSKISRRSKSRTASPSTTRLKRYRRRATRAGKPPSGRRRSPAVVPLDEEYGDGT
jgi:hypothetical protein